MHPIYRRRCLVNKTIASERLIIFVLQQPQCLLSHRYFISSHDGCSSQPHTQFVVHRRRDRSGSSLNSVDSLLHFHQLLQYHSCLQLRIVELHILRSQRHRDIYDNRRLIPYNRCCRRSLYLVSSLDIETIERLVHSINQQLRDYSSSGR